MGMGRQGSGQRVLSFARGKGQIVFGLLGLLSFTGCGLLHREQPQSTAKPGDLLVQVGQLRVELVQPFRAGEPNGLFDGVVKVTAGDQPDQLVQVNAICSIPDEPQWPSYDNLYGTLMRSAATAEGRKGDTSWQVLFHFNGRTEVKMGQDPGAWLARLHDNLCRHGDFDDRKIAKKS